MTAQGIFQANLFVFDFNNIALRLWLGNWDLPSGNHCQAFLSMLEFSTGSLVT